jgi:hypothetical protein
VGRGVQNYTCASKNSSPVSTGAVATLYDVSCLVSTPESQYQLDNFIVPTALSLSSEAIANYLHTKVPTAASGRHYFRADGTPYFETESGDFIYAAKDAAVPAPPNALGNKNGPAIAWLKLSQKAGESYGNIQQVYRVVTAGGAAPQTCKKAGGLSIEYVTEYWMY